MVDINKLQQKHREYLISKGLDVPELSPGIIKDVPV